MRTFDYVALTILMGTIAIWGATEVASMVSDRLEATAAEITATTR